MLAQVSPQAGGDAFVVFDHQHAHSRLSRRALRCAVRFAGLGTLRILLVSDLHYTLPQLDWVVRSAPSFDLVVIAGDHLDISSAVALDAQSVVILRYLALIRKATQVAASSGNHDLTGPTRRASRRRSGSAKRARPAWRPTAIRCGSATR